LEMVRGNGGKAKLENGNCVSSEERSGCEERSGGKTRWLRSAGLERRACG
jgi:hypothetical protein